MKKKLKKSLACLLAALLIFSAVPMSALADEADTPVSVTVETNAEKAAQDTEPDAEPQLCCSPTQYDRQRFVPPNAARSTVCHCHYRPKAETYAAQA